MHGTVLIILSYKPIAYKIDKEICWWQRKLKEGSEGEQDKHYAHVRNFQII